MNKNIEVSMLLDIYGKMLTKKQYNILNYYYNLDLSLTEIAENEKISKQAVSDNIKKGEKKLYSFEKDLKLKEKMIKRNEDIESVLKELTKITKKTTDSEVQDIVEEIKIKLNCLA